MSAMEIMDERRVGYEVGWWMFWAGFGVGSVLVLAFVALIFGVQFFAVR